MRLRLLLVLLGLLACPTLAGADIFRIEGDTIVEGSLSHGGIQPDYLVSKQDKELKPVLTQARKIGDLKLSYWHKVDAIRTLVQKALPAGDYDNTKYLKVVGKYAKLGKPIPLGEYVKVGAGVCRENAMLLHLALSEAGINSDVAYVNAGQEHHSEDHGLVVLRGKQGAGWTVDSYNENFNGVRFAKLLTKAGVTERDPVAPVIGKRLKVARRIIAVPSYPRVRGVSKVTEGGKMKRALGHFRMASLFRGSKQRSPVPKPAVKVKAPLKRAASKLKARATR